MAHGKARFKTGQGSRAKLITEFRSEQNPKKSPMLDKVSYRLRQVRGSLRRIAIKTKYRPPVLMEV